MIKFILFGVSTSLFSSPFISLFKSFFLREDYTDYPPYRSHYSVPQNPFTYSIRFTAILNCPNLHIHCGNLSYLIITFALCTNLELFKNLIHDHWVCYFRVSSLWTSLQEHTAGCITQQRRTLPKKTENISLSLSF